MGGAETWLVEMVKYAREHETGLPGFDFLAAGGERAIFDQVVNDAGCTIHYIALRKGNVFNFIRGLRKILKENNYIAIHDHQGYLSGWHFLFGIGFLPPVRVVHFHVPIHHLQYYGVTTGRRLKLKVGRSLLKIFATDIFGTSNKVLGGYLITPAAFPVQNIGPLYCSFQIDRFSGPHSLNKEQLLSFLGWSSETKLVLFAGRFDQSIEIGNPNNSKNSAFALEVIEACKDRDIKMIMVGANDFVKEKFCKLIESKNLQDRVRLLGIRNDMAHIMLASDVLLFPSRAEGMGMVAVEAQAAGLPVLASDTVPDEIMVLDEMVKFQSLNDSFDNWAVNLREMMNRRLPGDTVMDKRWKRSGFNMEVCCRQLASIYLNRNQSEQV
jgi:glycosyltransferase EpsF